MTSASRLNGVIRAWESGKPAFASFASADRGNDNVERVLEEGYRFLMAAPVRSLAPLEKGRKLAGR
jgi:hypothetical protein